MRTYINTQATTQTVNDNAKSQAHVSVNDSIAVFIISFPLILLMTVKSYQKYCALARRRRVEILEKMWLLNINNNTF